MAERIICIEDVGKGKKRTFFKDRPCIVFVNEVEGQDGEDDYVICSTQNAQGNRKILFSTEKVTEKTTKEENEKATKAKQKRYRNFLRKHFDLSEAPILRKVAGLE